MVALYPKLFTSLTKKSKAWEETTLGNNSAFAVHNNDEVIDVLHSGRQVIGKEKKKVRKKEEGNLSKPNPG